MAMSLSGSAENVKQMTPISRGMAGKESKQW
jgi:hypothetical protein